MVSTFFRRVAKHFANQVAVVSPNGQLLSADLDQGLEKWRQLPTETRRKLDDLGEFDSTFLPPPPKRGLIAKVYSRGLKRDDKGHLEIYKTKVTRSLEAGRDHLWLTETEGNSLLPEKLEVGAEKQVASAIVDRICRRYLIDLVRVGGNGGPRRPDEVLGAKMGVIVEEVSAAQIRIRIDGVSRLATRDVGSGANKNAAKIDDFELLGFATYDRTERQFIELDLIAFSETGHYDEIGKRVFPLGVVFDLSRGGIAADLVPPSSYSAGYFGSE
ncbi:MAG: hypothetical protein ACI8XO_000378 [Verrucomicrobiales bacterium]|jgi:hypothetical protein